MAQRTLHPRRLFKSWCSGAGTAQGGTGFVATLRVSALLAAALLSACAAPQKKPALEAWPEYKVSGSVGLAISLPVTPIKVRGADNEDVARLESAAEKKSKEASVGVGTTALTILTAPLAILTPLYPPAIQFAALPFMAADATAKARQDAERLQQEAAKSRLDSACSEQLAAAHPELAEKLQRTRSGEALRQLISEELRDALQIRAHVPVVLMDAQLDGTFRGQDALLAEAKERHLPTAVQIEVKSLDLSGDSTGDNSGSCRYKILTSTYMVWWNVEERLTVSTADSLAHDARLPLDSADLPALVDRPEEFRQQLARAFRDAVLDALNGPTLRFSEPKSDP
jgi:hypothetical protein